MAEWQQKPSAKGQEADRQIGNMAERKFAEMTNQQNGIVTDQQIRKSAQWDSDTWANTYKIDRWQVGRI